MRVKCYLIIHAFGGVRVLKRAPTKQQVLAGELVLPLSISIPDSAFATFLTQAEITVPATKQFEAKVEVEDLSLEPS